MLCGPQSAGLVRQIRCPTRDRQLAMRSHAPACPTQESHEHRGQLRNELRCAVLLPNNARRSPILDKPR